MSGTFACPICGEGSPHHHTAPVVDAYQNKRSRKPLHETTVTFRGEQREVQFEHEGDDVFVWFFTHENADPTGQDFATDAEQRSIYDHLYAWWIDWTAPRPEDDL